MLGATQRLDHISRIRALPAQARAAVAGLDDAQLDTPYREGGWTPRQVIHHLADSHMNAYVRTRLILTEDRPRLKPYDQEAWARLGDSRLPVAVSLSLLEALHPRWCLVLEEVPDPAWGRAADHPEIGPVTLDDILTTYSHHGENHVGQFRGLRKRKGW